MSAEEPQKELFLPLRLVDAAGRMGLLVTAVCTVAAFTGRYFFWGDVCSHFVHFFLYAGLAGLVLVVPFRKPAWIGLAAAIIAVNGLRVAPLYVAPPVAYAEQETQAVRLISINLLEGNDNFAEVTDWLRASDPDILAVQEITPAWLDAIEEALPELQYGVRKTLPGALGMAILSRYPVETSTIDYFADYGIPIPSATFELNGARVRVTNMHSIPAADRETLRRRNIMLRDGAARATELGGPALLVGDLNCGPWAAAFRDMTRDYGLSAARQGFGIHGTWTARTWPLVTPIDHVLHSEHIGVTDFRCGPALGSDHLPIIAELTVPVGG